MSSNGTENRRKGPGAAQCQIGHTLVAGQPAVPRAGQRNLYRTGAGPYDGSAASRCPVPMLGTSRGRLGVDAEPQKCDLRQRGDRHP